MSQLVGELLFLVYSKISLSTCILLMPSREQLKHAGLDMHWHPPAFQLDFCLIEAAVLLHWNE
jgi:hypothetical protein